MTKERIKQIYLTSDKIITGEDWKGREMKIFQKKSKNDLIFAGDGNTVKVIGPKKPTIVSGSRSVNSAHDFPYFYNSDALYLFADLREPACVSVPGTTYDVFLTPDQARFFCAPKKGAGKAMNSNDQIVRRSRQCTHALYPRSAARSSTRSARRQRICTANPAPFTAGAARSAIPFRALTSEDASSTAGMIWTDSFYVLNLNQGE